MKEEFNTLLPTVLPLVLEGCTSTTGVSPVDGEDDTPCLDGVLDGAGDDTTPNNFTVTLDFIETKVAALNTLTLVAYNSKQHMIPYLEQCWTVVLHYLQYVHPTLRVTSRKTAEALLTIVSVAYPPPNGVWKPGVEANQQPLSSQLSSLLNVVMPIYISCIERDPQVDVVVATINTLTQLIKQFGPAAVEPHVGPLVSALGLIYNNGTQCQLEKDDEEDLAEDYYDSQGEDVQNKFSLLEETGLLLAALAKVFRQRWNLYFPLCEQLMPWLSNKEEGLRSEAVATYAQIVEMLGEDVTPKLDFFITVGLRMMTDPYPISSSNAAYLAGLVCANTGAPSKQYYPSLLSAVPALFPHEESVDNACGLLGRMIMANPDAVPLEQVLPIMVSHLPLKRDMEENKSVYPVIAGLVLGRHPAVAPLLPTLVQLFCELLSDEGVQNEVKEKMGEMLVFLFREFPVEMQQVPLSELQRENLQKLVGCVNMG
eukprot:TRINITY_DN11407_c0_g1_i2.p1 TRINITY_DN11407_c0_g1~~TRINITY_DN11407_c0_g1_i2.p1  ORF type:complete len:483 (-),score=133.45 TRINITY_DN11407_c0_g1_i2:109-1557(-)